MTSDSGFELVTTPPRDAAAWTALLDERDIPVLRATALAVDELRANEDAIDAHMVAGAVVDDPLMTLKLLRYVAARRSRRATTDAETVLASLVLLGIPPFFAAFPALTEVETLLRDRPQAMAGLERVLRRSHRAARFALGFAVHRMDHDAAVIHEAALLHDFAEMLVWIHAPDLALEVARRQQEQPSLRSADAQRSVLHVTYAELQHSLMTLWRLPELLIRISDDHQATTSPQVRNVVLAVRIARHSSQGWDNPALPDDLSELGALLNLSPPHVQELLADIER